jgi:hypothetical protein
VVARTSLGTRDSLIDYFVKFLGRARGIESLAEESILFKELYNSLNIIFLTLEAGVGTWSRENHFSSSKKNYLQCFVSFYIFISNIENKSKKKTKKPFIYIYF